MIDYENLKKLNAPFEEEFQKEFIEFLNSGWYILGDRTKLFEQEFARYLDVPFCIGVGNGLDAMIIALNSLELPSGSEVIVPSNTYIASILAILKAGYKPVLVEPDIATYNIDPLRIEEFITEKTKAILVVHLYGKSCQMDSISEIASKNNLYIIEDCAQSHGSEFKGKKTGTFGVGCFSFYPTKNLGALGDGGAIVTQDESLTLKFKTIRNYGSQRKYENELIGVNSRLDEIQSCFLRVKLKYLNLINNHKRKLANIYLNQLTSDVIKPVTHKDYFDVFHIFNIRTKKRDELKEFLLKNDIKTEIHYPIPPHKQKAMIGVLKGSYPIAEEIHQTTLSLPISYFHTESDVLKVCETINSFFQ
ncbi:DegT/DnrJ/EryC1/StrS family aminotransferase [Leptospira sp. 85282-16]|uniref:DegT/DnrJ/EryC1/StrS family aminotransferase n=1 Tax=Leptospira sp. 85282-16 TaxID=2971256 RepID=UPI0021C0F220|nr:DegT/DnrJ/EryC1/StrS family aminotransferase [Leptospira sp. 85282-16]MCT8332220.1 DegT/DnrJ/EryC1/StrS family aminotransferase [Leptospira sp. 85282-16]